MTVIPLYAPAHGMSPAPAAAAVAVPGLRDLGAGRLHAAPGVGHPADAGSSAVSATVRGLTAREREVLLLLADGLSNREVALHLYISEATVKSHVARVLATLQVRDRVQAVIVAFRAGLVPLAGPRPTCPCCS